MKTKKTKTFKTLLALLLVSTIGQALAYEPKQIIYEQTTNGESITIDSPAITEDLGTGSDSNSDEQGNEPVDDTTPEGIIRKTAKEEGFEEIEKLVKLAKCENRTFDLYAVNPKNNSFDRGIFQISRKFHPEVTDECAFNAECATKEAIRIQKQRGWNEWAYTTLICMNK